ncbi:hypothetical protein [Streptomyces sp. NPDC058964]
MDARMDRLHELVSSRPGPDPALERPVERPVLGSGVQHDHFGEAPGDR